MKKNKTNRRPLCKEHGVGEVFYDIEESGYDIYNE